MPRSNKKRTPLMPPPKDPPNTSFEISSLLAEERNLMIKRAISSGRKHGVNLEPGSSNPGLGDCAFEAVIQNVNSMIAGSAFKINSICQSITTDAYGLQIWLIEQWILHGTFSPVKAGCKAGKKCKCQAHMREAFLGI